MFSGVAHRHVGGGGEGEEGRRGEEGGGGGGGGGEEVEGGEGREEEEDNYIERQIPFSSQISQVYLALWGLPLSLAMTAIR